MAESLAQAKTYLVNYFKTHKLEHSGIGKTKIDGKDAILVNLIGNPSVKVKLPTEANGFKITYRVIDRITKRKKK